MLCPRCHRQIGRGAAFCPKCGASLNGSRAAFDLVLGDGTHLPLLDQVTIGRAAGNTLQLSDPSVSRHHAAIVLNDGSAPVLEDKGSSYGTWLDGSKVSGPQALRDGSRIRIGNTDLRVVRRRDTREEGRTLVVPVGESVLIDAVGDAELGSPGAVVGDRPRLRSGYALKRLAAEEGPRRWVLNDLRGGRFFHFSDDDAAVLQLLNGRRTLSDLAAESERRLGSAGPAHLARVLADLGSRGLLAGQDGATPPVASRLLRPRELAWTGARMFFDRLYARGGWLLFTRPAQAILASVALVGVFAFVFLIAHRYGTPFVVARKVGLGGAIFVVGRFAVAAFHETAHGLTMASFGRHVRKAGFKLVLIFPYAYVDTSEAWFEPRRHRIAISAAGPASDFVLGGTFALASLAVSAGAIRDILFQLAFAAYLGALFNLNPMLERDGYHMLVDILREPGLRRRAREELAGRLRGEKPSDSRVLRRYALLSLAWSTGAALFVAVLSVRYEAPLAAAVPTPVAWLLIAGLWAALFTPVALMVGGPLRRRLARR